MLRRPRTIWVAASLLIFAHGALEAREPGLLAHYPLDGNAHEQHAPTANGSLIGGTAIPDRFGHADAAIQTGGDCSVHIPTAVFEQIGAGDFSVIFWFKAADTMSKPGSTIVRSTTHQGGRSGLVLWFATSDATPVPFSVAAEVWSGGKNAFIRNNTPLNDNTWRQAALIRHGGDVKFYLDGELVGTAESPSLEVPVLLGPTLILGNGHDPYDDFFRNRFVGAFDDLRIYDRALSTSDLVALRDAPVPANP